jgi:hypothetical protein
MFGYRSASDMTAVRYLPSGEESRPVVDAKTVAAVRRASPEWPLGDHLELAALTTAVPCARVHARAVVTAWGMPWLAADTELIVSELVTNAIRAMTVSPGERLSVPVVKMWLTSDLACVLIRVWDSSPDQPVRQRAEPEYEGGRGLMIVDSLSREWGTYHRAGGKVVWAKI